MKPEGWGQILDAVESERGFSEFNTVMVSPIKEESAGDFVGS